MIIHRKWTERRRRDFAKPAEVSAFFCSRWIWHAVRTSTTEPLATRRHSRGRGVCTNRIHRWSAFALCLVPQSRRDTSRGPVSPRSYLPVIWLTRLQTYLPLNITGIIGLAGAGALDDAWSMLVDAQRDGVPLYVHKYTTLIHGFVNASRLNELPSIIEHMESHCVGGLEDAYELVVKGFLGAGDRAESVRYFDRFIESGYRGRRLQIVLHSPNSVSGRSLSTFNKRARHRPRHRPSAVVQKHGHQQTAAVPLFVYRLLHYSRVLYTPELRTPDSTQNLPVHPETRWRHNYKRALSKKVRDYQFQVAMRSVRDDLDMPIERAKPSCRRAIQVFKVSLKHTLGTL